MRVTVLSRPDKIKCPTCRTEIPIVILKAEIRGTEKCPNCKSMVEWDITEDIMPERRGR